MSVLETCSSRREGKALTVFGPSSGHYDSSFWTIINELAKSYRSLAIERLRFPTFARSSQVNACVRYGFANKADKFQFSLTRDEPFYGHLRDRFQ